MSLAEYLERTMKENEATRPLREFFLGFQRSRKGNLWREYEGLNLSVFQRDTGVFDWSLADEDGPRFSSYGWETEEEALDALSFEVDALGFVLNPLEL